MLGSFCKAFADLAQRRDHRKPIIATQQHPPKLTAHRIPPGALFVMLELTFPPQSHAQAFPIFLDKFDAGGLESALQF
jgi:hypothetical protein